MRRFTHIGEWLKDRWSLVLIIILCLQFGFRLLVYYSTKLFYFSDYQVYLHAIDRIYAGENLPLNKGTFLYTISYLGYVAKYWLGNLDWFFVFNSLLGVLATLNISIFVKKLSGSGSAALLTAVILCLYTEFIVFSSVFYTPVIMIFLLSSLLLLLWNFYDDVSRLKTWIVLFGIAVIFFLTFLFKPELVFLPAFLMIPILIRFKNKKFIRHTSLLIGTMLIILVIVKLTGIYGSDTNKPMANDFIFFGHTDYGGDGGEGSFIYLENEERYSLVMEEYCRENEIVTPDRKQINDFQRTEIIRFVSNHPFRWVKLQFTKFSRTFGVVPESNSLKILYSGLLEERLWLSSIIVVLPLVLILLLSIQLFNLTTIKQLLRQSPFTYIYFTLFLYYIIATCFFGHYQERYRMPILVCFIIPFVSIFVADLKLSEYLKRSGMYRRSTVTILVLVIWIFQVKTTLTRADRLENALELVKERVELD